MILLGRIFLTRTEFTRRIRQKVRAGILIYNYIIDIGMRSIVMYIGSRSLSVLG